MIALLTSYGRPDLLRQTKDSFFAGQQYAPVLAVVHEDHPHGTKIVECHTEFTKGIGQHASIEKFIYNYSGIGFDRKYYLHIEDDWLFENSYDWIQASLDIMEADPTVIKVLCNSDSPHSCEYDHTFFEVNHIGVNPNEKLICKTDEIDPFDSVEFPHFGYLQPWENNGIKWHGFSWNPGVTRLDLLKQFIPFPKWEQELAENIYKAGYKVVRLEKGVCRHIGQGRSTHD